MDLSHLAYELPSKKHVIGGKIGGKDSSDEKTRKKT
jgi:hypothetical protein